MAIAELEEDPPKTQAGKGASVVVFYAVWCGDCVRSLIYEKKLSAELAGKVAFYRMDAERFEPIADIYWVDRYPTYVFFKDGKPDGKILVEPAGESEVRTWLSARLGAPGKRKK
jgi:thiol-disulfide isomerase/thioredoxin